MQSCPFLLNEKQPLHTRTAHDSHELLDLRPIELEEIAQPVGWGPRALLSGALLDLVSYPSSRWASPTGVAVAPEERKMSWESHGTGWMQSSFHRIVPRIQQVMPARGPTSCGAWYDRVQPHPGSKRHQRKGGKKRRERRTPTARKSVVASISEARHSIYRCEDSYFCFHWSSRSLESCLRCSILISRCSMSFFLSTSNLSICFSCLFSASTRSFFLSASNLADSSFNRRADSSFNRADSSLWLALSALRSSCSRRRDRFNSPMSFRRSLNKLTRSSMPPPSTAGLPVFDIRSTR